MLRLPRLSLRWLFVAIALVPLLPWQLYTSYQLKKANAEIARRRRELGSVQVDDPKQFSAAGVALPAPESWRFEVYKPAQQGLVLYWSWNEVPWSGLPDQSQPERLVYCSTEHDEFSQAATYTFELCIANQDGEYKLYLRRRQTIYNQTTSLSLPEDHPLRTREIPRQGRFTSIREAHLPHDLRGEGALPMVLLRYALQSPADPPGISMGYPYKYKAQGLIMWVDRE